MKKLIAPTLFILFLVGEIILRLYVSSVGHNFDGESWLEVSKVMQSGKVVYNTTSRYNYGPIWSYILYGLSSVNIKLGNFNVDGLHTSVVVFLSLVDACIAVVLYKMYGKVAAVLFMASPVAILLTGFHSQIDNLAVLLALMSWYFYNKTNQKYFWLSAVLLGLSLATKHVLLIFPIWLLFSKNHSIKNKVTYALIAYGIFGGGFVVEILRDFEHKRQIITGITEFVFKYKSSYGQSVLFQAANLVFPINLIDKAFSWLPVIKGYTFVYFMLLIAYGWHYIKKFGITINTLPVYLLAFTALTPSFADQYLAIALPSIAIFWQYLSSTIFTVMGFAYLATGNSANISNYLPYQVEAVIGSIPLKIFPWDMATNLINFQAQAWILILCVQMLFEKKQNEKN